MCYVFLSFSFSPQSLMPQGHLEATLHCSYWDMNRAATSYQVLTWHGQKSHFLTSNPERKSCPRNSASLIKGFV